MPEEKRTLLVVDDQADNRDMLARRLTRKGYRVLTAADGQTALDLVAREPIDLVLLDVMMPGLDGVEVLRRLRESYSTLELPVIMVTARSESDEVVDALETGANDYVTKPIDFPVILARVQAHLRTRQVARSGRPEKTHEIGHGPRIGIGPGTVLADKYRLESTIGSGSFGVVYRARHLDLQMEIAVKVLHPTMAQSPDALSRFQREGISACRLRHPNAVAVMDFGVFEGIAFLVMELLQGRSLDQELALAGRLSLQRTVEIALPICSVLAESHQAGIIHRDIKPANVLLHHNPHGEVVKVLDFGIAKLRDAGESTMAGVVFGTPAYMAPERFQGAPYDGSSDIYSLGTIIYQALAGRLPFVVRVPDPMAIAQLKIASEPEPLRVLCPDLPIEVEDVVMRTLRRSPSERPTASALAERLASALGLPREPWMTSAPPPSGANEEKSPVSMASVPATEVLSAADRSDVSAGALVNGSAEGSKPDVDPK